MSERVSSYDIYNNPTKAWNTFADSIGHLQNDLFIMKANVETLGEMPKDIQKRLQALRDTISRVLAE